MLPRISEYQVVSTSTAALGVFASAMAILMEFAIAPVQFRHEEIHNTYANSHETKKRAVATAMCYTF